MTSEAKTTHDRHNDSINEIFTASERRHVTSVGAVSFGRTAQCHTGDTLTSADVTATSRVSTPHKTVHLALAGIQLRDLENLVLQIVILSLRS